MRITSLENEIQALSTLDTTPARIRGHGRASFAPAPLKNEIQPEFDYGYYCTDKARVRRRELCSSYPLNNGYSFR